MKKTTRSDCRALRLLATALLLLTVSVSANAYDFEVENYDGVTIYYNVLSEEDLTCEVTYQSYANHTYTSDYSGNVVIPETVTYDGNTYTVTSIGGAAFCSCSELSEIVIPNSVTTIGSQAFQGCTVLTEVTIPNSVTEIGSSAFYGCTGLTSVTIPNSVTSIGNNAFYGCTGLTGLTIGNSVTTIGTWAFYRCTGLTGELTIPNSVTEIGDCAFEFCSGLTSVTIGNGVTQINGEAFAYCEGLTSVTIPNSVTTIGESAFYGCTGLTSVTIPNSVTEIKGAFDYCTKLRDVTFEDGEGTLTMTTYSSHSNSFTNCPIETLYLGRNLSFSSSSYSAFRDDTSLASLTIGEKVTNIPANTFYGCTRMTEVAIPESVTEIGSSAFYGCTGLIDVTFEDGEEALTMTTSSSNTPFTNCPIETVYLGRNLSFSSSSYSAFRNNTSLASLTIGEKVTNIPNDAFYGCSSLWSMSNTSVTQTTCTIKYTSNISGASGGIYYNNSFSISSRGDCTITGLTPGNSYNFYFGIMLNTNNNSISYHGSSIRVTTAEINLQITQANLTPESITATGSYNAGDAEVTETGFTGYTSDGATLYLTNLEPKTQYTVEYYVIASGKKFTTSTTFTTPAVEFTTLPAKATSNTVALLGATTNLSDDAVGAGFEWRRYDAPSTMPSNQAECPVIDGELTGTLNGLSATTYYDFRPYYTSQGGTTYYGEWITFITADAYVYFEPTVRTYSATSVGSSSATVKAYAVAGSDNITSQGFEYWQGGSSSAMNVRRASTTDENGVTRVEVSGQWMTATLEDLEPSTTYSYRAYVTTAVGTTYGETMSFTTDVPTGIEGTTLTEDVEAYEIARYTLDGKKISHPQRGINIVRYSDGTVKKVMVK